MSAGASRLVRCRIILDGPADADWIVEALAALSDLVADGLTEGRGQAVQRSGRGVLKFEIKRER